MLRGRRRIAADGTPAWPNFSIATLSFNDRVLAREYCLQCPLA